LLNPPPGSGHDARRVVHRPGRGEDHPRRARGAHRAEHRHRAGDVHVPVQVRPGDGLGDLDLRGEVQHALEAGVGGQHLADLVHRKLVELNSGRDGVGEARRQVVEHHDLVARPDQGVRDHAADVSGPARHQ
jgi:hypothetical protein